MNQIEVRPSARSDGDNKQDVVDAPLKDPATDSCEIRVSVKDVILQGTVESWAERDLCEKVAKGVESVVTVDHRISVDYRTDRSDYEIKAEIEKRLDWDVLVDDPLIDVNVSDGKVSLSGTAGSAAEKRRARRDA